MTCSYFGHFPMAIRRVLQLEICRGELVICEEAVEKDPLSFVIVDGGNVHDEDVVQDIHKSWEFPARHGGTPLSLDALCQGKPQSKMDNLGVLLFQESSKSIGSSNKNEW